MSNFKADKVIIAGREYVPKEKLEKKQKEIAGLKRELRFKEELSDLADKTIADYEERLHNLEKELEEQKRVLSKQISEEIDRQEELVKEVYEEREDLIEEIMEELGYAFPRYYRVKKVLTKHLAN